MAARKSVIVIQWWAQMCEMGKLNSVVSNGLLPLRPWVPVMERMEYTFPVVSRDNLAKATICSKCK